MSKFERLMKERGSIMHTKSINRSQMDSIYCSSNMQLRLDIVKKHLEQSIIEVYKNKRGVTPTIRYKLTD